MNYKKVIKWLYHHAKPFIPSILFIIIIGAVSALTGVGTALASKKMIDFAVAKELSNAMVAAGIFFTVVVGQVFLRAYLSTKTVKIQERFTNTMRSTIYKYVVKARWSDIIKYHSDDMLTRMTSDIHIVTDGIVNVLPGIITLGIQLVFAFVTLFYFDPVLAVLAILIGPLTVLFYRLFKKKLKEMHMKIQESESIYRAYLHECLQNISIIKVFSQEDVSGKRVDDLQNNRTSWVIKRNALNVKASSILSLGYYIGYMLSFCWGAFRLAQSRITFGTLTAFFQLVGQVQSPFISIARSIPQLIATEGSALRLMELENLEKEPMAHQALTVEKAGVILENISFEYKKDTPILKNASVDIRPGEIVSIIGPSGEGKTTIIRLLLSLLEKQNGKIFLTDGHTQYSMDASLRKNMSYVPQGNTLFSGTILENLTMGAEMPTVKVDQALRDACAYDFVYELKENINTLIGEKGLGLSEGQAQRLAIARALLKEASILIFDEATSALDEKTEMNVLKAIKCRSSKPTCLFITHRPGVYALSDRILRLENGNLLEVAS